MSQGEGRNKKHLTLARDKRSIAFVRARDEVLVVALTESGDVLLVVEPSPAFGTRTVILPGGTLGRSEPREAAANRELQEEIGFKASRLDFLGELRPWSKYLRVRSHVFLGRDLEPSRLRGDEDYTIGIERMPLATVEGLIASGHLMDARAIAGLHMARVYLAVEVEHLAATHERDERRPDALTGADRRG